MRKAVNIVLTLLISVGFILLGVFVFRSSYLRFWETLCDFGRSVAFYFCELFSIDNGITPTVNDVSEVAQPIISLPSDISSFKAKALEYFSLLLDGDNFRAWVGYVSVILGNLAKLLVIVIPVFIALLLVVKWLYKRGNNKHNKDTLPLRIFKFIAKYTYQPMKRLVRGYVAFLCKYRWIWICWVVLWVFHFNLASIATAFFAYYFYFAITFEISTIYMQICKLFIDVQTPFLYFPWWGLLFFIYPLFNRWRVKIALSRLRHYEARNCGFINELPIVSMTCGSMGKKKTTMITDMALSQEVMFRQKALDIIQSNDMKFPYFPWICFEKELRACMENDTVYNLATVKQWVKGKREEFKNTHEIYNYDCERYGLRYDDALKIDGLFDVLEVYAQAYFIYVITSSLIVSNYSIRTDNRLLDEGNFPVWLTDIFQKTCRRSRHAKVLDFDILRLGKKVIENNPNAGSFEFGVVVISEVGKERGNNLELKEVKKGKDEANQKNDLFNSWLKMCRHSATVDNFPFIKVFTDEQRPESWGADARDLCDIIHIVNSSEQKLALPFYTIEDMIAEWAFNRFVKLYYDFRFRRGDNTLLVHILKSITAAIWHRNVKVYNRYGYCTLKIEKERGTMDGKVDKKKYYIMNLKAYRKRFATDCFSDYFNDMAKNSKVGLADYREYVTERADVDELKDVL